MTDFICLNNHLLVERKRFNFYFLIFSYLLSEQQKKHSAAPSEKQISLQLPLVQQLQPFRISHENRNVSELKKKKTENLSSLRNFVLIFSPLEFSVESQMWTPFEWPPTAKVNGKSGFETQLLIFPWKTRRKKSFRLIQMVEKRFCASKEDFHKPNPFELSIEVESSEKRRTVTLLSRCSDTRWSCAVFSSSFTELCRKIIVWLGRFHWKITVWNFRSAMKATWPFSMSQILTVSSNEAVTKTPGTVGLEQSPEGKSKSFLSE